MGFSDTMGNQGAFITLKGKDMEPKFTTYEAVVSCVDGGCMGRNSFFLGPS